MTATFVCISLFRGWDRNEKNTVKLKELNSFLRDGKYINNIRKHQKI